VRVVVWCIEAYTMSETPQILRPIPRRTFQVTPASNESSVPPSPSPENTNPDLLEAKLQGADPPSRTRSILNLTSSTLLGIYSPTGYEVSREEPSTPWGTGAQTPSQRQSVDGQRPLPAAMNWDRGLSQAGTDRRKFGFRSQYLPPVLRGTLLFAIGIAYGTLITHLHDDQKLAPVKVEAFDRHSWGYILFWGLAGVTIGNLQLWVDFLLSETKAASTGPGMPARRRGSSSSAGGDHNGNLNDSAPGWTPVVRSIGAFVGIAFAVVSYSSTFFVAALIVVHRGNYPGNQPCKCL
jgi:Insulin-induced protein (INSIG)